MRISTLQQPMAPKDELTVWILSLRSRFPQLRSSSPHPLKRYSFSTWTLPVNLSSWIMIFSCPRRNARCSTYILGSHCSSSRLAMNTVIGALEFLSYVALGSRTLGSSVHQSLVISLLTTNKEHTRNEYLSEFITRHFIAFRTGVLTSSEDSKGNAGILTAAFH